MEKKRFRKRRIIRNRKVELAVHGFLVCAAVAAVLCAVLYWQRDRIHWPWEKQAVESVPESGGMDGPAISVAEQMETLTIEMDVKPWPSRKPLPSPVPELTDSEMEDVAEKLRETDGGSVVLTDTDVDWRMVLVNPTHRLPEDFQVDVKQLPGTDDVWFDARAVDSLEAMLKDCEKAGHAAVVRGSYRTMEQQQELFDAKTEELVKGGLPRVAALLEAATVVAYPGTSEHQLGLAVDIVSVENTELEKGQEDTPTQRWLMQNSWRYGFILRYPTDRSEITGIIYEPWHYRYVGNAAAQIMYEENLCFEEFLARYGDSVLPEGTGYVAAGR